jgi:16S rRNA (cytidine1402-2'-O)-methyltransferase
LLYLVATPIGNLSDISLRALETLKMCDYLLCEDTRKSSILLRRHEIKNKLESYHLFNEKSKLQKILNDLKNGMNIALLSDGGSPAICDPGETLTAACIKEEIPFTLIPGPAALIQALILSGLPINPFQFLGFIPRKKAEIMTVLPSVLSYPGTSVFYESPKRLKATLDTLAEAAPDTEVAVARELTKTFEEVVRGNAQKVAAHFEENPPRGEIVLLIKGMQDPFAGKEPEALVKELMETYKLTLSSAIKAAAHFLNAPKQSIYKLFHQESSD